MDWNSLFHSKYLRGGLCAALIAAILLGLWLPGTGLKEAQPDDPLQGEGVREITVLKLGENLEQLNTISVPSGGQTKSTEPNDKASETRPEETQPDSSTDDGSDGQEDGNQGADGGEVSPSELSLVLTWNAKGIACAAGNTQAFSVSSYELNEDLFRFRVSLTGTQAQDAKIVNGISITESTQTARELKWPSDSLIMNPAAGTDKEVYNFSFTVRTAERDVFFRYKITYQKLPDVQLSFTWRGTGNHKGTLLCMPSGSVVDKIKSNQLAGGRISYEMKLVGSDAESAGAKILSASYISVGTGKSDKLDEQDFLDIEMPGLNGINTATELIKRNPSVLIIIVTSHLDYLDDAMKIHVFRYLTKPVEKKRLSRSLADAVKIYAEANATAIVYTRRHGPIALKKSDIICIEAEGRYSYVYTKDDKIDSVNSLSEWMNVLAGIYKSYNFYQVHRSFIINMNYITNYSPTELSLSNGFMTIPLARRKRVEFKRQYLRHLERIR